MLRRRGRRRAGWGHGRAARIVLVGHAFLHERIARLALKVLVVGAELAGRHFGFRRDGKGRHTWQQNSQQRGGDSVSKHGGPPSPWMRPSYISTDPAPVRRQ